jgi:hypothetical protein
MKVHARLGKQRGRIEVIRILLRDFAHGIVIFLGRLAQVCLWIRGEALGHCLDVVLLGRRSARRQVHGFLDRIVRLLEALFAGRIVVIGSHRFGDAPIRDRQFRIEVRRALKRTRRFVMIEGVDQTQALIEKILGLRVFG